MASYLWFPARRQCVWVMEQGSRSREALASAESLVASRQSASATPG
jgi:hypothetical protein